MFSCPLPLRLARHCSMGFKSCSCAGPRLASTLLARDSLRLVPPRPPSPRSASPGLMPALLACKAKRPPLARLRSAPLRSLIPSRRFPCVFRNIITNPTLLSGARSLFSGCLLLRLLKCCIHVCFRAPCHCGSLGTALWGPSRAPARALGSPRLCSRASRCASSSLGLPPREVPLLA